MSTRTEQDAPRPPPHHSAYFLRYFDPSFHENQDLCMSLESDAGGRKRGETRRKHLRLSSEPTPSWLLTLETSGHFAERKEVEKSFGQQKKFRARWAKSANQRARKGRERAPPTDLPGQAEGVKEPVPGLEDQTGGQPTGSQAAAGRPVSDQNVTCDVTNRRPGDQNDLASHDGDTESGSGKTATGASKKSPPKPTSPKETEASPQTTPPLVVPPAAGPSSLPQEGDDDSRIVLRLRRKSSSTDEGGDRDCPVGFERSDEYEVITDTETSSESSRRSKYRENLKRRRRAQWSANRKRSVLYTDSEESESASEAATPRADSPAPAQQQHHWSKNREKSSSESRRSKYKDDVKRRRRAQWSANRQRSVLYTDNSEESESATDVATPRADTPAPAQQQHHGSKHREGLKGRRTAQRSPSAERSKLYTDSEESKSATEATRRRADSPTHDQQQHRRSKNRETSSESRRSKHREDVKRRRRAHWSANRQRSVLYTDSEESESASEAATPRRDSPAPAQQQDRGSKNREKSSSESRRSKYKEDVKRRRRAQWSANRNRSVLYTDSEESESATDVATPRADTPPVAQQQNHGSKHREDLKGRSTAQRSQSAERSKLYTDSEESESATEAATPRADSPAPAQQQDRRSKYREDQKRRRQAHWSANRNRSVLYTDDIEESESATDVATPRADTPPPAQQQQREKRKTYKGANSPQTAEEARRHPETPWRNKWYWKTSDEDDESHSEGSWSNSGYETPVNKWDRPTRSLRYNGGGTWSTTAYGKTATELIRSPPPSPPTPPVPRFLTRPQSELSPPPPDSPRSPRHPDYPIRHGIGNSTQPMSFYRAPSPVLGFAGPEGGELPSTSSYPDCQIGKFEGFSEEKSDEEQTPKRVKSVIKKARKKRKPKKRLKKGEKAPEYIFKKSIFVGHGHGIRWLANATYTKLCSCSTVRKPEDDQPTRVYAPWTPPHTSSRPLDSGEPNEEVTGAATLPATNLASPGHDGEGDDRKEQTASTTSESPCDLDGSDHPTEGSPVQPSLLPSTDVNNAVSPAWIEAPAIVIYYGHLPQAIDEWESGQGDDRKEHATTTPPPCDSDKEDRPSEESPVYHTPVPTAAVSNAVSPATGEASANSVIGPLPQAVDECESGQRDDRKEHTATTPSPCDSDKEYRSNEESPVNHTSLSSAATLNTASPARNEASTNAVTDGPPPQAIDACESGQGDRKEHTATAPTPCESQVRHTSRPSAAAPNIASPARNEASTDTVTDGPLPQATESGQGDVRKEHEATTASPCDAVKADRPNEGLPVSTSLPYAAAPNSTSPARNEASTNTVTDGTQAVDAYESDQGDDRKEHTATTSPPCDRPNEESPVRHTPDSLSPATVNNAASPARIETSEYVVKDGSLPQDGDACDSGIDSDGNDHTPTPTPSPRNSDKADRPDDRKEHTARTPPPCDSDKEDRPSEEPPVHHTRSLPSSAIPDTTKPARAEAPATVVAYGPLPQATDGCESQAAWETGGKTPSAPHTPVPDPWSETSSSSEPTDALGLWYKKYLTQNEPPANPVVIPTASTEFLSDVSNQNSDRSSETNQPFSSQISLPFKWSASSKSDSGASTSSSNGSTASGSDSASHDSQMCKKKRKHDESEESSDWSLYPNPPSSDEDRSGNTGPSFGSSPSPKRGHDRRRHGNTSGRSQVTASAYVTLDDDSNTRASHISEGSRHSGTGSETSGYRGLTSRGLKRKTDGSLPSSKRFKRDGSETFSAVAATAMAAGTTEADTAMATGATEAATAMATGATEAATAMATGATEAATAMATIKADTAMATGATEAATIEAATAMATIEAATAMATIEAATAMATGATEAATIEAATAMATIEAATAMATGATEAATIEAATAMATIEAATAMATGATEAATIEAATAMATIEADTAMATGATEAATIEAATAMATIEAATAMATGATEAATIEAATAMATIEAATAMATGATEAATIEAATAMATIEAATAMATGATEAATIEAATAMATGATEAATIEAATAMATIEAATAMATGATEAATIEAATAMATIEAATAMATGATEAATIEAATAMATIEAATAMATGATEADTAMATRATEAATIEAATAMATIEAATAMATGATEAATIEAATAMATIEAATAMATGATEADTAMATGATEAATIEAATAMATIEAATAMATGVTEADTAMATIEADTAMATGTTEADTAMATIEAATAMATGVTEAATIEAATAMATIEAATAMATGATEAATIEAATAMATIEAATAMATGVTEADTAMATIEADTAMATGTTEADTAMATIEAATAMATIEAATAMATGATEAATIEAATAMATIEADTAMATGATEAATIEAATAMATIEAATAMATGATEAATIEAATAMATIEAATAMATGATEAATIEAATAMATIEAATAMATGATEADTAMATRAYFVVKEAKEEGDHYGSPKGIYQRSQQLGTVSDNLPGEDGHRNMAATEYAHTQGEFKVSEQMKADFDRHGFIIVRNLLDEEEIANLSKTIDNKDGGLLERAFHQDDGGGLKVTMIHWKHPGSDVSGIIARSKKLAGTFEKLLGGEVYHYSGKVNMKEAHSGGQHLWHQDYGYWYNNGLLYPDMATVYIAVDKADKTNGCLQVLRGSHLAGRVEHKRVAGETGADDERVEQLKKLDPGDAVLFHCNVLHRSDQNRSDRRRRAYLVSYNRASNNPVYEHYNASYVPLEMVDDAEIRRCENHSDFTGKEFVDPADNKNISGTRVGKH
ncbi:hypothetical protein Bbelb_041070 [Branchiostoma belcheri]|nr:hypothetical protein Bbelb_041070 [Branchiostoma belcheri]